MATTVATNNKISRSYSSAWIIRNRPLLAAVGVYLVLTCVISASSLLATDHHLVYPLDDTYIGMAIARSLALHEVWGVTRFAFGPASSSPLFTLILAAMFRVFGVHQWFPLLLSLAGGIFAIQQADLLMRDYLRDDLGRAVALVAFVFLTPLFTLGVLGMEHSLHLALSLALLNLVTRPQHRLVVTFLTAGLLVEARYEGVCLVLAAAVLLSFRREFARALSIFGGTALATCAYGIFAVSHGASFLPNSVALKAANPGGPGPLAQVTVNCTSGIYLFLLCIAVVIATYQMRRGRAFGLLTLILATDLGHLLAGRCGYAFRYDAYAVGCSVVAFAIALTQLREFPRLAKNSVLAFAATSLVICILRAFIAAETYPVYSRAIYFQQWQVAHFLREYYPTASVAANDIGAISFWTDIRCLDLVGLSDPDVFRAKRDHRFTTAFLDSLSKADHVQLALVYDEWFPGKGDGVEDGPALPPDWVRVATLRRPHEQELGKDVVSFYAVGATDKGRLAAALRQYESKLPAGAHLSVFNRP